MSTAVLRNDGVLLLDINGNIASWSADGRMLFTRRPNLQGYFDSFAVVKWAPVGDLPFLLVSRDDRFVLLSPDGNNVLAELPADAYVINAHAVAVKLFDHEPPLLAVTGLMALQRTFVGFTEMHSVLYLFDEHHHKVYEEVFEDTADALATKPSGQGRREVLLVGRHDKVWRYTGS